MNSQIQATPLRTGEPAAERAVAPVWLFVVLLLLLFWAMAYFDQNGGWFHAQVYAPYHSFEELKKFQQNSKDDNRRGQQIFEQVCALCHGNDGMGKPNQAPQFVGSEWVLGPVGRLARIPVVGLSGPIEVAGKPWTGSATSMPAMGAALSDDDLAAVLSYMRQSWGNKAAKVTPQQVKAVKAELGNRAQPMTVPELMKIEK